MAVDVKLSADGVEASLPKELLALSVFSPASTTYEPTRDPQRFLVLTAAEQSAQSLNLIVNWPALLNK
jgi:hypothetical protein